MFNKLQEFTSDPYTISYLSIDVKPIVQYLNSKYILLTILKVNYLLSQELFLQL